MEREKSDSVGSRLECILKSENIEKNDLAKLLQINPSYVTKAIENQKSFSNPAIELICKTYNINRDWLLYGIGEMYTNKSEYDKSIKKIINTFNLLNPDLQSMALQYFKVLGKLQDNIDKMLKETKTTTNKNT